MFCGGVATIYPENTVEYLLYLTCIIVGQVVWSIFGVCGMRLI